MSTDDSDPSSGLYEDFLTEQELGLVKELRQWADESLVSLGAEVRQRVLLSMASELVDSAADTAAQRSPGIQVVQLGLLAERLTVLARDVEQK